MTSLCNCWIWHTHRCIVGAGLFSYSLPPANFSYRSDTSIHQQV